MSIVINLWESVDISMKKNIPLVNIIIVTYNEFQYTKKCIESLLVDGYDNKKIILVDNASERTSYQDFIKAYQNRSDFLCIRSEKNLGFGGGCNLGIQAIESGYIVFLNNDTEVSRGWLDPMVDYMEENQEVGACQPKIMSLQNKEYFEYAGAAGGFMDIYGYPFTRGRIFYTLEKDAGQYDNTVDLVWCSGTAMMTRKSVLDVVGQFDEIFFMYGEEADLCWRIHRAGWRLSFVPKSIIYHYGMGTMSKNKSSQKIFLLHRNGLILLLKNYSFLNLLFRLPVRIFFDSLTFFYYIYVYSPNAYGLLRSYFGLFLLLFQIMKHRLVDKRKIGNRREKERYPLYQGSIVLDYFLFKRKKFSDLPGVSQVKVY